MQVPDDLRYTREHEWIRLEGDDGVIGITDFAQDELGDVVFVDLPRPGEQVTAGETFGEIESVKTVSDLFAPVTGEVVAVNEGLADKPELVNQSPYEDGWLMRVRLSDSSEVDVLLDAAAYRGLLPATE
jgi:glycine cleavage system H protein